MSGIQTYSTLHKVSSLLMLLALAWLTISLPFVYDQQQAQKKVIEQQQNTSQADDSNLMNNTTEEKTGNSVNTLAEYLHEVHTSEHLSCLVIKSYKGHSADLYIAFHPEYICPPPDTHAS